jgi:hypothetical protein
MVLTFGAFAPGSHNPTSLGESLSGVKVSIVVKIGLFIMKDGIKLFTCVYTILFGEKSV